MILHLVTDRRRLAGPEAAWTEQCRCLRLQIRFAVEAGIDVVQIRERDLEGAALLSLVEECVAEAVGSRTRILVNDRVDVALAARAQGVHLRSDSLPASVVRGMAPRGFVIGRSVHDADEAASLGTDVDYLIAGTVWPTVSKPPSQPLLGLEGLAEVVQAARVPVLAIGGVTLDRVAQVAGTRAAGVAAIGLFITGTARADRTHTCGAVPLHDVARGVAARCAGVEPPPV